MFVHFLEWSPSHYNTGGMNHVPKILVVISISCLPAHGDFTLYLGSFNSILFALKLCFFLNYFCFTEQIVAVGIYILKNMNPIFCLCILSEKNHGDILIISKNNSTNTLHSLCNVDFGEIEKSCIGTINNNTGEG